MKCLCLISAFLVLFSGCASTNEPKIPKMIGRVPDDSDGPNLLGPQKHGIQIGFSKPKEAYRLNHPINIWIVYAVPGHVPKGYVLGKDVVTLTKPDGTTETFPGDTRIDVMGGIDTNWFGGMCERLHDMVRHPGIYKMQWKLGDLESPVITFKIVP